VDVWPLAGGSRWWKLVLYSEGEYVFDTSTASDSFFYNWSELSLAPVEWFRIGVVTQRTRAYKAERELQRGLLVGVSYRGKDLSAFVFNPDNGKPLVIIAIAATF